MIDISEISISLIRPTSAFPAPWGVFAALTGGASGPHTAAGGPSLEGQGGGPSRHPLTFLDCLCLAGHFHLLGV